MSYTSIVEMTASAGLRARVAACAADEGYGDDPVIWAQQNMWTVVTTADWVSAWDSAHANPSNNWNPDTGVRDDVITDAMILAVVADLLPRTVPGAGD